MPDTFQLESQIADADREMKAIDRDAGDLQRAVDDLLSDFRAKYGHADTAGLSEAFSARLADIVDDLQGPAYRRKSRLEDEIGNIEFAELESRWAVTL